MSDIARDTEYRNPFDLHDALQLWQGLLAGKAASTIDCYVRDVRLVATALELKRGTAPRPNDIMALDELALHDLVARWASDAPSTNRRRLVSVRRFGLMLASTLGMTGPLLHCRFPALEVMPPHAVPTEVLTGLVEATNGLDDWVSRRDRAILAVVADRGLTTGEMRNLDRSHLTANILMVRGARGGLRFVTLSVGAAEALRQYLAQAPCSLVQDGPLWLNRNGERLSARSIQLMLRRHRDRLGLPANVVAGAFRRQRIIALAASGMSVDLIAAEFGIGKAAVLTHLVDA